VRQQLQRGGHPEFGEQGSNIEGQEGTELIPVLSIILHPFKESNLTDKFGQKEALFAIHVNRAEPEKSFEVIKFIKALEVFKPWEKAEVEEPLATVSQESQQDQQGQEQGDEAPKPPVEDDGNEMGIFTPSFADFFDENFMKGKPGDEPYQPLNNATEIPPVEIKDLLADTKKKKKKGDETIPKPSMCLARSFPSLRPW
jgi:hypothetical protein